VGGIAGGADGKDGAATLSFVLPPLVWIAYVRHVAGAFYSHEVDGYRQFVWMADSWSRGGYQAFLMALAHNTRIYVPQVLQVLVVPAVVVAIAVVVVAAVPHAARTTLRMEGLTVFACSVTFALDFVFFWALGYYAVRLTWSIVPPLLVASGIIVVGSTARLSVAARRLLVGALVLFAASLDYYTIVKLGPWC
jgi:hypothetical protein